VLLAVPALRAIRAAGEPVVLAAQPAIGSLLAALGVVDGHVSFEGLGLSALFVDDGPPPRVAALERAARVVCWFGSRDPVFARRLAQACPGATVAPAAGEATSAVWRHLLATVGSPPGEWCEPVTPSEPLLADGRRVLEGVGWDGLTPLVIAHPGAGGLAKRWPAAGFARALASVLEPPRAALVITEGPADRDAVAALHEALGARALVLRHPSLVELAGALRFAAAYVGNDSGVSHLAATVGAPALVLFDGAKLAWRPWSPTGAVTVVELSGVADGDVDTVRAALAARVAAR
jgi:hypothetical protein